MDVTRARVEVLTGMRTFSLVFNKRKVLEGVMKFSVSIIFNLVYSYDQYH